MTSLSSPRLFYNLNKTLRHHNIHIFFKCLNIYWSFLLITQYMELYLVNKLKLKVSCEIQLNFLSNRVENTKSYNEYWIECTRHYPLQFSIHNEVRDGIVSIKFIVKPFDINLSQQQLTLSCNRVYYFILSYYWISFRQWLCSSNILIIIFNLTDFISAFSFYFKLILMRNINYF